MQATDINVGSRNLSFAAALRCSWPALVLAAVCLLPFLNKGFTIDDPFFLGEAQQILRRPLHPMDFDICWMDEYCTKAYALTPGNALMGYILTPVVLSGGAEWFAHLMQLFVAFIALIEMAALVLRLGWSEGHARMGALLLVVIPPFLPMASTAMPDLLAATLGLIAMERLAAWKAEELWRQGVVAAVAFALAAFARSHLLLLLGVGAFFLFDSVRLRDMLNQLRRTPRRWVPVVMGAALLFAIILATRERSLALNPSPIMSGFQNILPNLRSYFLYFAFPLPLLVSWIVSHWKPACVGRLLVLLVLGILGLLWGHTGAGPALLGAAVLAYLGYDSWRMRDHQGLVLLCWMLIPVPIAYYLHLPIKYVLPVVPAVILMIFRWSEFVSPRTRRAAITVMLAAGTAFSCLLLLADNEFANQPRIAADLLIKPYVRAGQKVWFGGEWGFYWYAPRAGAKLTIPGGPGPQPGELLAVGLRESGGMTLGRFPKRTLVSVFSPSYRFGRTMGDRVSLYSNRIGIWLWGPNHINKQLDRYELWRVN